MTVLYTLLLLLATLCFAAAAFNRPTATSNNTVNRLNLVALGLFFWVLVPLIETARHLN
jgi:hypothetical protein